MATSDKEMILVFEFTADGITTIPLKGHKGKVTSLEWIDGVLYSTDDKKTVIGWTIEKGKGFILSEKETE